MRPWIVSVVLGLAACGGGGGADPLVGTWKNSSTSGTTTSSASYTFNADKSASSHAVSTDSTNMCTTTDDSTATWAASGSTLTITPGSGTCTRQSIGGRWPGNLFLAISPPGDQYSAERMIII